MDEEMKNSDDDTDDSESMEEIFEIGIPVGDIVENLGKEADAAALSAPPLPANASEAEECPVLASVSSETTGPESLLEDIRSDLASLSRAFESKLKYDAHKNKIIDDLHQALQDYREGLIKKYVHRIVMDIIKIVDDIRKFTAHHRGQPPSEEATEKLLHYTESIASDLEDLFSWEGVLPFTCKGEAIDLSRQRILQRIATDDPEKDKTVAERLRPGYEWDGKVIRPEMISAFIFQTEPAMEDHHNE